MERGIDETREDCWCVHFFIQGVRYLVDLLNLKQVGAFLVEDLTTSWRYILIALALAALVSVGTDTFSAETWFLENIILSSSSSGSCWCVGLPNLSFGWEFFSFFFSSVLLVVCHSMSSINCARRKIIRFSPNSNSLLMLITIEISRSLG